MKLHKVVEVEWLDTTHHGGWEELEDARNKEPLPCKTVGYLIKKTRATIITAETQDKYDRVSGLEIIPRSCVTSIKER